MKRIISSLVLIAFLISIACVESRPQQSPAPAKIKKAWKAQDRPLSPDEVKKFEEIIDNLNLGE